MLVLVLLRNMSTMKRENKASHGTIYIVWEPHIYVKTIMSNYIPVRVRRMTNNV